MLLGSLVIVIAAFPAGIFAAAYLGAPDGLAVMCGFLAMLAVCLVIKKAEEREGREEIG